MTQTRNTTSPALIQSAEFRRAALELRREGNTYARIAELLQEQGITKTPRAVEKGIKKAISEITKELSEEVIALELDRLDMMLVPALAMAIDGNLGAVDRVLKIMDRRARYLGLDVTPAKDESGPEEIRMLMAGFAAYLPPPPGSCGHGVVEEDSGLES
ncbi:MAG: hypothetical protein J0652_07115 [Desulfobulbaceae bacterium]|jgi:hypothetical protein|nr:hypothetical protein [Desulfobulbaceae bacterium]